MTRPVLPTRARVLSDPATQQLFLGGLRMGLSIASAAASIGLTREAVRLYRKVDPAFNAEVARVVVEYERSLLGIVNEGCADDSKLALEVLARRFPQRWSPRQEIRQFDQDDEDPRDDELSSTPTEDLEAIARGGK